MSVQTPANMTQPVELFEIVQTEASYVNAYLRSNWVFVGMWVERRVMNEGQANTFVVEEPFFFVGRTTTSLHPRFAATLRLGGHLSAPTIPDKWNADALSPLSTGLDD